MAFKEFWCPEEGVRYKLRGVVIHGGVNLFTGHYTACVCNNENVWFLCDDSRRPRQLSSVEDVLSVQAYMLFYERQQIEMVPSAPLIAPLSDAAL